MRFRHVLLLFGLAACSVIPFIIMSTASAGPQKTHDISQSSGTTTRDV